MCGSRKHARGFLMSSDEIVIRVLGLSKRYQLYDSPRDRLKQFILPRIRKLFGLKSKKYFRDFWALKDVSFEIKKGETIGIVGRNGSGKSTLLQLIAGTLQPTNGSVEINGRVAALLELGSGFNMEFTGRENVYMNAAVLGLSREEIDRKFEDIASFANIGQFMDQSVKLYSSGMLVRLAFAVSVCIEPDILIVDEALAVGDVVFQFRCLGRLRKLIEQGTTLLFVSHDAGLVRNFCNKALLLEDGRLQMFGSCFDVTETYIMNARKEQVQDSVGLQQYGHKTKVSESGRFAFGSSQGKIVKAVFKETLSSRESFWTGDSIKLSIDIEYSDAIKNPALSLIVMDSKMLAVAGKFFPLSKSRFQGGVFQNSVNCLFQAPFSPGEYFITLRLEDRVSDQLMVPVDKQVGALSFQMISKNMVSPIGVLDLEMEFFEGEAAFRVDCES
jgi:lipopolysaccharide transport system ATP-binding protein